MTRLHEFDALRGIAALAVVFAHLLNYVPSFYGDPYNHWSLPLWSFTADGQFSVLIFFAISGFVLSFPYFNGAKNERNLIVDTLNRLPRLMIPVFLTGLLCLILQDAALRIAGGEILDPFYKAKWVTRWNPSDWDVVHTVEFLTTQVFVFYSETDTFNVNLWTMPVELAFSLIVFSACAVSLRRYDIAVLLVVIACLCIASWRASSIEYMLKFLDSSTFFLGVAAARYRHAICSIVSRVKMLPMMMMGGGLILSCALVIPGLHYLLAVGLGLSATALFFIGFVATPSARSVLSGRVFGFLGEVSFALYLIHGSVLYFVFQVIASLGGYGWGMFFAGAVLSLTVSLFLSFIFTRHVEAPLVSVVRRAIGSRVRDRSAA